MHASSPLIACWPCNVLSWRRTCDISISPIPLVCLFLVHPFFTFNSYFHFEPWTLVFLARVLLFFDKPIYFYLYSRCTHHYLLCSRQQPLSQLSLQLSELQLQSLSTASTLSGKRTSQARVSISRNGTVIPARHRITSKKHVRPIPHSIQVTRPQLIRL